MWWRMWRSCGSGKRWSDGRNNGGGGVTARTNGGGGGPTPEVDACAEDRGQCWAWQVEQQNLNEG